MAGTDFGQAAGALSKAANMTTEARADFDRISSKLSGQIATVQSGWAGLGAASFFRLHETWSEKQRVIVAALEDFSTALTGTERENIAADEERDSDFRSLASRLG